MTQLRPVAIRKHHRLRACPAQRVGDERILPDRDQRILPHHEQHVDHRPLVKPRVQRVEPLAATARRDRRPCCAAPIKSAIVLDRIEHPAHGLRIARVHGDAQVLQRVGRLETVDRSRRQHEIRMQRHDRFEARILRIAHVRFRLRRRRRVAIIRIAREPVFEAQRVNRFRQVRRERHDPPHLRRHRHAPPDVVGDDARIRCLCDVARGESGGESHRRRARNQRARRRSGQNSPMPRLESNASLQQKSLARIARLIATLFLAKSAGFDWLRAGFLTLGLTLVCSARRSQWRDRGRFSRPSTRLSKPVQLSLRESMPRPRRCQPMSAAADSLSGSSTSARAFRPARANLLANLRARRVR